MSDTMGSKLIAYCDQFQSRLNFQSMFRSPEGGVWFLGIWSNIASMQLSTLNLNLSVKPLQSTDINWIWYSNCVKPGKAWQTKLEVKQNPHWSENYAY